MKIPNANRIRNNNHYVLISRSTFLTNLTPPIKQSFKVKPESKSREHASNLQTMKKFILFVGVKVEL